MECRVASMEQLLVKACSQIHSLTTANTELNTKIDTIITNTTQLTPTQAQLVNQPSQSSSITPLTIPPNNPQAQPWVPSTPPPSVFLIKPKPGSTTPPLTVTEIGELAASNSIPLDSTKTDGSGKTWVTLATSNIPIFQGLVEKARPEAIPESVTIKNKTPSIVIVGLTKKFEKQEVFDIVKGVNPFGEIMDDSSFKVLAVNPTRNNPDIFQAIVAISDDIRTIIKNHDDKVHFWHGVLKIYDNFYIKRCSRCQAYGHHCKNKEGTVTCNFSICCAVCAGDHLTSLCTIDSQPKCNNCSKAGKIDSHRADSSHCPTFKAAQDKLKGQIPWYRSMSRSSKKDF